MAVAPDGTLYISFGGEVHHLGAQGNDATVGYTDSRGNLVAVISGIALGKDGSLAATDHKGDLLRFGSDGIVIDGDGRIYVSDANGAQVFDANEKYLYTIPLSGGADAIALDSQDNLYAVTYPPRVIKLAAQKPQSTTMFAFGLFRVLGWISWA